MKRQFYGRDVEGWAFLVTDDPETCQWLEKKRLLIKLKSNGTSH
jgi:hypothetical protein